MVLRFLLFTLLCCFGSLSFGQSADFVGSPTTICVGGSVQFTDLSVGAASYSWTFVDGGTGQTSSAVNPNITYNNPGVYTVILTIANGPNSDTEVKAGYITVLASASANLTSGAGTDNQTICGGSPLTNITYAISGATGVNFSGLPSGVAGSFVSSPSGGNVTISGTPSTQGTFPYSFTTTGANCAPITVNGTITVGGNPTISLTSGSTNQTICVNTPMSNIVYSIGGSATGATVSGLPAGVSGTFSGGSFTISGTPTATGSFPYTVTTTGGPCPPASLSGVINVDPDIQLLSGSNNQTVCENTPIVNIVYTTGSSTTGATVSGLPAGVSGTFSGGTFTISGTPTVSGVFNYTVTTTGGSCGSATASGTITVNPAPTLVLDVFGTDNQLICFNDPIVDITYTVGGSATGASVIGLPAGITGSFASNVFTITGTPAAPGVYNYTVSTTGSSCGVESLSGAITVEQAPLLTLITAAATDTQEVCLNTAIDSIVYLFSGAVIGATVTNLPAGVNFSIQNDSIVIFGSGLSPGISDFLVVAYGGSCPNDSAFGQINVSDVIGFNLISAVGTDNQLICDNIAIDSIIYQISSAADTAYAFNIPAGLTTGFSNDSLFISGTPTSVGVYNFGVVATGGFCPNDTLLITLTIVDPQITLASAAATDTQTWCLNSTIDSIIYTFSGATGATVLNLPLGLNSTVQGDSLIISGTATSAGIYPFTVYTTGNACVADSAYGLLTIADSAGLALVSAVGTDVQVICEGEPIDSIVYVLLTAADTAVVTGLPLGVSSAWSGDSLIITGSPTNIGLTNYQIVSSGGVCPNDTLNGSITVLNVQISLVSPAYSNDQTVLVNTPIAAIVYSIGGPVMVTDLPPGIIATYTPGTPNLLSLTGTPSDTGAFYYVVQFAGDCGTNLLVGKILVVSTFTPIDSTLTDTSNIYVPNLFSPNGDGFNDTWQIPALASFPNNEVTVINREGQIVFNEFEYTGTWNGSYNGKPLPEATYYYLINIEQGTKILRGPITILRNEK